MSKKGGSRHIKRLSAPRYMKISRKSAEFVTKPNPGRYDLQTSTALITVVGEKLGLAKRTSEARRIIKKGLVEVNSMLIREPKYPVGLADVITLKPSGEHFVVSIGRYGEFETKGAKKAEIGSRTLKVVGKYLSRGNRMMVRLSDGSVLGAEKNLRVNDSVVLENGKPAKTIRFEKGARCMVVKGIHAPEIGTISEVMKGTALRDATVKISSDRGSFETIVENVMVIGA